MRDYFCGWYFKCQSETQTLAVIPAIHRSKNEPSCSVQIITDDGAWPIALPYDQWQKDKDGFRIRIGENTFGEEGIQLHLHAPALSVKGDIRFGKLSRIRYDIMGPFQYVPFMQCRHSILSMEHTVNGTLCVNGKDYRFHDAVGYIEGDRGYSFPKEYAWTQCSFPGGSLMLSVADIPWGPARFTGVIGVIRWQGQEYRLATYLGAKAVRIHKGEIVVRQGHTVLTVKLIERRPQALMAPVSGAMTRTIHESASCRASYCFRQNADTLFSFETPRASFEYEYPV